MLAWRARREKGTGGGRAGGGKESGCVLEGRFGRVPASAIPPFGARAAVLIQEFSKGQTSHIFNILCKATILPATNLYAIRGGCHVLS